MKLTFVHILSVATMTFLMSFATIAYAQQQGIYLSPIVVVDTERLYLESKFGAEISRLLEVEQQELIDENRRIEAELTAEEKDLTQRRPSLNPEEFRALADAFDEKVQSIRQEQDEKQRSLQNRRNLERSGFLDMITPILSRIAQERGAAVVMEKRTVLLSASVVDITDDAIARIDVAIENYWSETIPQNENTELSTDQ